MVTVELTVGNREINAGVGSSCTECPIALAAIKAGFYLPKVSNVISFLVGFERCEVQLPNNAYDFISTFDVYKSSYGAKRPKPTKVRFSISNSIAKLLNIKRRYIVA